MSAEEARGMAGTVPIGVEDGDWEVERSMEVYVLKDYKKEKEDK